MSQRIADLESYYLIQDQTVREVFRQAFENQRILQTQLDELKESIKTADTLTELHTLLDKLEG